MKIERDADGLPTRFYPPQQAGAGRARSKYGAVRTTVDNITFHSKGEAKRYQELRLLERAGEISNLELQPAFPLCAPTPNDAMSTIWKYIADFAYIDKRTKAQVVEDFKGFDTQLARWKRKHMEAEYGITVLVTGTRR